MFLSQEPGKSDTERAKLGAKPRFYTQESVFEALPHSPEVSTPAFSKFFQTIGLTWLDGYVMEKLLIEILEIEQDNQSGSVTIVDKTVHALLQFGVRSKGLSLEPLLSELRDSLQHLLSTHNQFGALHHLTQELLTYLGNKVTPPTGQTLIALLTEYQDRWRGVDDALARTAASHIDLENKCLLLHSKSSAVTKIFQHLREKGCRATVFQTESRPAFEGRQQAEALLELGFEVHLIVDSAVSAIVNQLDMALFGADNVTPKFFVNKIGSYGIALICRDVGIPVYVVADTRKFMIPESLPEENPKGPGEIWEAAPRELAIVNFYFERISNDLVDGFITEESLETSRTLPNRFS